ncbi:LysR family transcriptional regulator [Acinetobacter sp. ANC 5054]|uniref:LysR substrate-binding domain-containing protein n=1 Tax=Acinetobacter sp. ANC 5054 TaxID=1977877 RepID=UPI000A34CE7B|nr:LysR substrate-binding domain-containing protein [Acinetobacter sp. ANC 5054]OTG79430.1 LysR family transcriptional regulator [Acinetobacter sp. ANC 5054]
MRRNIPSLQSLICFESAAKHASYTHASQELFITQSAVSRQIQQLEEFLGVSLFSRTRHGVDLTEAGKQYAKSIKPFLQGLEKSTSDLMTHKGLGGTLKIGVVPTFATRWLLPKLHRLNAQHPEITLHLETSTKPFLFNDNIFDAAIFAGTEQQIKHWPGIQAHFLMNESIVPVCSPTLIQQMFPEAKLDSEYAYHLSPEQLIQLPLLQQTTRPMIWQEWFQAQKIQHEKPFAGQRHELFSMLAVAATHGMGMALIPKMLIESELKKKELVLASTQQLEGARKYYLIHSSHDISPMIVNFVEWMKQELNSAIDVNDLN